MPDRIKNLFSSRSIVTLFILVVLTTYCGYGETFSFAIIADPHIDLNPDHKIKLISAVDWIIRNKDKKDIELVFVLGDIAWGGSRKKRNLRIAREILDRLNHAGMPYVPVIGDNEIQKRCEKEFEDTFNKQYQYLSKILGHWRKAPTPVGGKYLQNFSFDYKGCHFISCDFNSRKPGDEGGELHDFTGGSWPWFKNDIETCPKAKEESIVIITHIGMFRTGFGSADQFLFSQDEMLKIQSFLFDYRDYVDSNYAGHIHLNWHSTVWTGFFTTIYHVRTTDETWYGRQWPEPDDKETTVRLVKVNSDGNKVLYNQQIYNAQEPNIQ
jgi:hypothetical protein